jgi:hypothetical protein
MPQGRVARIGAKVGVGAFFQEQPDGIYIAPKDRPKKRRHSTEFHSCRFSHSPRSVRLHHKWCSTISVWLHHLWCSAIVVRVSLARVHATAELIVTDVLAQQYAPSDDVDFLAERYLAAEKAAAEAYRIALAIDQPHERLQGQLISLADYLGQPVGPNTKLLRGAVYEVRVSHVFSNAVDHEAVNAFGNMLRRHGVRGLFQDVFQGTMHWQLRPDADEFLKQVRLPHELQNLYDRCRCVERTPSLEVGRLPIVATSPEAMT